MEDPNVYAPRSMKNADVIDRALTDALSDALSIEHLHLGWECIEQQLKLYGLLESDACSAMLEDYTAGFEGLKMLRDMEERGFRR